MLPFQEREKLRLRRVRLAQDRCEPLPTHSDQIVSRKTRGLTSNSMHFMKATDQEEEKQRVRLQAQLL